MPFPRPVLSLPVVLAACAAPPVLRPPVELAPFTALRASHFPGASSVLAGFAAPDDDPTMRVGDAALFGLEVHRNGRIDRQLVLLEVAALPLQQPAEGAAPVRRTSRFTVPATFRRTDGEAGPAEQSHTVHALDVRWTRLASDGRPLRASVVTLFEEPLATGFWPRSEPGADERADQYAGALTQSLQEVAGRDPVLQELLFRVVDEPGLWSIATHAGLQVVLHWDPARGVGVVPLDDFAAPVRRAACELRVNGDAAAAVTLLVTKPRSATRLCGGLVGAIAQHPDDPERLAVLRLLATRRGPAPFTR